MEMYIYKNIYVFCRNFIIFKFFDIKFVKLVYFILDRIEVMIIINLLIINDEILIA